VRILVIDDDQIHGESLVDLLGTRGHEAFYAPTLDEARWLLGLLRFDVALVDHDMPEVTGPQVAHHLLAIAPALRTIVMSARESNRESLAGAGLTDTPFVLKPIRIDGLIALVTHLTAGTSLIPRRGYPVERYRAPGPDDEAA
jgi:DNA-binding response OmpR family regulator